MVTKKTKLNLKSKFCQSSEAFFYFSLGLTSFFSSGIGCAYSLRSSFILLASVRASPNDLLNLVLMSSKNSGSSCGKRNEDDSFSKVVVRSVRMCVWVVWRRASRFCQVGFFEAQFKICPLNGLVPKYFKIEKLIGFFISSCLVNCLFLEKLI